MLDAYKQLSNMFVSHNDVKYFFVNVPQPNYQEFNEHWHDNIEILLITDGSMHIYIDDNEYLVKAGDLVIITPGQHHKGISGPQSAQYHILQFEIDKFYNTSVSSDVFLKPLCNHEVSFVTVTNDAEAISATEALIENHKLRNLNPMRTYAKVYELLGILYDNCNSDKTLKQNSEKFSKIFEYINSHYTEKITTKTLCEKFGYTESYFCRVFKKITGLTVVQYINQIRMERCIKMLNETNDDIGSIALASGFTDFSYFCYLFKREYGLTPNDHRKNVKGEKVKFASCGRKKTTK